MPTYTVMAAAGRLTDPQKREIARDITRIHSEATGAQGFFAQVIFQAIPAGDHFLGGAPLVSDQLFVQGQIRAGRSADQKRGLLEALVTLVANATGAEKRSVWVYLSELPPSQMVEYGRVLPAPGAESEWLNSMPEPDRKYLLGIGK
jgi:phenylpyruvate tautomerase PptA (4-oxalocrotonate tautomerase family)